MKINKGVKSYNISNNQYQYTNNNGNHNSHGNYNNSEKDSLIYSNSISKNNEKNNDSKFLKIDSEIEGEANNNKKNLNVSVKSGNSRFSSLDKEKEKEKANASFASKSNDSNINVNVNLDEHKKYNQISSNINYNKINNLNFEKIKNNTQHHNNYHSLKANMSEMEKYNNYVNNNYGKSNSITLDVFNNNGDFWDDKTSLATTLNFNSTLKEKFTSYLKTNHSLIKTTDINQTITKNNTRSNVQDNIYTRILKTNMNYKKYYRVKEKPYKSKLKSQSMIKTQGLSVPNTSKDSNYISLYEKGVLKSKMRNLIYENAKYNKEQKRI